jgi:hypothetical protein
MKINSSNNHSLHINKVYGISTYGRVIHGFAMLTHYLSNEESKTAVINCIVFESAGPGEGFLLIVTNI